jgi:hypothetical protein
MKLVMNLIVSQSVMAARFSGWAGCSLLFCVLTCQIPLHRVSAQAKEQGSGSPNVTLTGEYTQWSEGPDGSSSITQVLARDGSFVVVYDYLFKSGKGFKSHFEGCTKAAFRVVEDSKLPGTKKRRAGRRTLILLRDGEGRESALLCRTQGTRMLTQVWGTTIEHVLGFERNAFPR